MLDSGLDEVTRERARATGIDWREAWLGIDAEGQVRGWPAAAAEVMGASVQDGLIALELGTALEPMRSAPAHASEMISEVRAGERLKGILRRDAWWLVAGEDGYVGWIHEWVVREADPERGPAAFLYARPLGTLWISDNHAAVPLVMGTPLWPVDGPMPERGGFHLLATASGEEGWVSAAELWPVVRDLTPRDALNFGRSLIGTPYRWGGRSPLGFDCSGFVQFIASLCAARLPRDASQQSRIGEALELEPGTWKAGDLLFFGEPADHVAMTDGRGQILHCQGRVRLEQISRREDLMERLSAVRRWWGLRDARPAGAWSFRGQ
jgi:hypothetical protein